MNIDTAHFKTLLENEKKILETELSFVATKDSPDADVWSAKQTQAGDDTTDQADAAGAISNFEENDITTRNLKTQLYEVDAALERMKDGTYGVCEIGGEEIEVERLQASPSARTCKKHLND